MRGTIRVLLVALAVGGGFMACRERGGAASSPASGVRSGTGVGAVGVSSGGTASGETGGAPVASSLTPTTSASATPPADAPLPEAAPAPAAPGCLAGAQGRYPKPPAPPLALSGRLGLWVAELDPRSLSVIRARSSNPDSLFPLASTYKQAVLWAVLREFDSGRLDPTERFDVTRANQSLGDYPYDRSNVRTLTERMIQFSDNTATDILHRRVGLNKVQDVAGALGLCRTRIVMPTKSWWVMEAGLSDTFNAAPDWGTLSGEDWLKAAQKIDAEAQTYRYDFLQRRLDDYFDHRYQASDDLRAHNLSTPQEWGTLVAHEFLRPGLSPRATRWQREVMATGYGRSALRLPGGDKVVTFGGKGGNGWRILTFSGYLKTSSGRHFVYAFMQHGADETYTIPHSRRAFAWINAALADLYAKP